MKKISVLSPAFLIFSFLSLGISTTVPAQNMHLPHSESWYRQIHIDAYSRLVGVQKIDAHEAQKSNAYYFIKNENGDVLEIRYKESGRALADPLYGVSVIKFRYEEDSILQIFSKDNGSPMINDRGVWSQRLQRDAFGQISGIFHYDQYLNLIPDSRGVALRLWDLDQQGRRILERFFNEAGARVENDDSVGEIHYIWDDHDQLIEKTYHDKKGAPVIAVGENVHGYRWIHNSTGQMIREERFDTTRKFIVGTDGSAMIQWRRNSHDLVVEESHFDAHAELAADREGVSIYLYTYDSAGNKISQHHLGVTKKPVPDRHGITQYQWHHYSQGNELEQLNFDEEKNLKEDLSGVASYRWVYDEAGLVLSAITFGKDDLPKKDPWGIAQYRYSYDANRNLIEASSYSTWEQLANDARGVAIYRWENNKKGQRLREYHYDQEKKFTEDSQGIAEYHWTYDSQGRRLEQRQYGLYKQLRADPEGVAVYTWNYDGYGRVTEQRHYGIDARLVNNATGAALARWSYGVNARPLALARFDRRTLPID